MGDRGRCENSLMLSCLDKKYHTRRLPELYLESINLAREDVRILSPQTWNCGAEATHFIVLIQNRIRGYIEENSAVG